MTLETTYAADLAAVREAAVRIAPFAHRTPVHTCTAIDDVAGRRVLLKCENFQKIGAFKFRGACNAIQKLDEETAARGVVTHSSGNHAQAIALAAKLRGIRAHIVMPSNASAPKRAAVEGYGARVVECEPTLQMRESTAAAVVEETGGTLISPFDHPDVIAGQGTVALELLEDHPELEAIVAPVGGGGLLSGICVTAAGLRPGLPAYAGEPEGADDVARSMVRGQWVEQTDPRTLADGLLTSTGELTWPIIRDHCAGVFTVSDDEIVAAMRLLWERAKLVVEPSGAVSLAAVLSEEFRALPGIERVAVVLSGGNVDLAKLPW